MQPNSFPIAPVYQPHRLMERLQPSEDGIFEFTRTERGVVAQPYHALSDSQQVADTMNKFPIHQLQTLSHRVGGCYFRGQPQGGPHEIVHATGQHPCQYQSQETDHEPLLLADLSEVGSRIELHQHLSSCKVHGGPNQLRDVGAVSYTHLRAHETGRNLVCRLLLEKKKTQTS